MSRTLPRVDCPSCWRQVTASRDGIVRPHTRFRDSPASCAAVGQATRLPSPQRAARMSLLSRTTEAQWEQQVLNLAALGGWRVWHDRDSRKNRKGLPDLLLWRLATAEWLAVELKTETGALTLDQDRTLREWRACGKEVAVWRPRDVADIETRLARRVTSGT